MTLVFLSESKDEISTCTPCYTPNCFLYFSSISRLMFEPPHTTTTTFF